MIDLDIESSDGIPLDISEYGARGWLSTRSLGSAIWDNTNMRFLFSVDFYENMLAFIQERSLAGKWQGASLSTDAYIFCGSVWYYIHIVTRLYKKDGLIEYKINGKCKRIIISAQLLSLEE